MVFCVLRKISDKGASLTEYALLVSLIAAICLVAVTATGGNIEALMGQTSMATSNLTVTGTAPAPVPGASFIPVTFTVGSTLTAQIDLAAERTIPFTAECKGDGGDKGKATKSFPAVAGTPGHIDVPITPDTGQVYVCVVNGVTMTDPGSGGGGGGLASNPAITYTGYTYTGTASDTITATFTASAVPVNGFDMFCDDGTTTFSTTAANSPITLTGLAPGTYTCSVSAKTPDTGVASDLFNPVTLAAPVVQTQFTGVTATESATGQITVGFTPDIGTGGPYTVSCTNGTPKSNTGGSSPIVVSSLTPSTTYTCTITATDGGTATAGSVTLSAAPLSFTSVNTGGTTGQDVLGYANGNFYQMGGGSNSVIGISADGTSWSTQASGLARDYSDIGSIGGNEVLVADGTSNNYRYRSGSTGTFNNAFPSGGPTKVKAVACSTTECVTISDSSTYTTKVTFSGTTPTWVSNSGFTSSTWKALAYGNGKYVAVNGSAGTKVSSNAGTSWSNPAVGGTYLVDVVFANGYFYGIQTSGYIVKSVDGSTWTNLTQVNVGRASADKIAVSPTGVIMALKTLDSYVDEVAVSTDGGYTWSEVALPAQKVWYDIAYGDGKFVVLSLATAAYTN